LTFPFTGAYVEYIHDVLVAERMPFDEPINPFHYRDHNKLESAVGRPFQTFCGADLHLTLFQKAAALFHSIACNHAFLNGNKRTAVMALDMFMTANDHFLFINDNDMYQLSKDTVEANMKGIKADALLAQIATRIESESMPFGGLVTEEALKQFPRGAELHAMIVSERDNIRLHPLNSEESKI
jgi:death-on-curing family protein